MEIAVIAPSDTAKNTFSKTSKEETDIWLQECKALAKQNAEAIIDHRDSNTLFLSISGYGIDNHPFS